MRSGRLLSFAPPLQDMGATTASRRPPASFRLCPGDPLPRITLTDAGGKVCDLTHQLVAGRPQILWFTGPKPTNDILAQAAEMAPRFAAVDARLYLVAAGGAAPRKTMGAPAYGDPNAIVSGAIAPGGPALALCTPGWRLARLLPADAIDGALAWCTGLFEASQDAPPALMTAPVLIIPDVLEPDLRDRCTAYWTDNDKSVNEVASSAAGTGHSARDAYKRRADVIVRDPDLFNTLKERIVRRIVPEIAKCYSGRISNLEGLRIGCYHDHDAGEFVRHRDNATQFTAHRQFAVSIVLNTGEFEGGWLRFPEFGRTLYQPPAGGALVFATSLLHEVLPVTKGRRLVLLTFLFDQIGAQMEQRMLAQNPGKVRG